MVPKDIAFQAMSGGEKIGSALPGTTQGERKAISLAIKVEVVIDFISAGFRVSPFPNDTACQERGCCLSCGEPSIGKVLRGKNPQVILNSGPNICCSPDAAKIEAHSPARSISGYLFAQIILGHGFLQRGNSPCTGDTFSAKLRPEITCHEMEVFLLREEPPFQEGIPDTNIG